MNMGAYRHDYLARKTAVLMNYKNNRLDEASAIVFKEKCVRDEDILFRQSKNPIVYNGWCLNDDDNYRRTDITAPAIYTNRICEYYPQVGVYKLKQTTTFNSRPSSNFSCHAFRCHRFRS